VFPNGVAFLVGADDVVLVASESDLSARLSNVERHWQRAGVAEDLAEVAVSEPFSLLSLFVAGPQQLQQYSANAALLTDDTMTLEFSGPRDLRSRAEGENGATLSALLNPNEAPVVVRAVLTSRSAEQWRRRGDMLARRDAHTHAYEDYVKALQLDRNDSKALDSLVRSAILTNRASDALSWIKSLDLSAGDDVARLVAISKLLAAIGSASDALAAARQATEAIPAKPEALEQLASVLADSGDAAALDAVVVRMRAAAPNRPATGYYAGVAALLHGRADESAAIAERVIAADKTYAPVYDLLGAAYTKLSQTEKARTAFETSLTFDSRDSTAYTNLGLLALAEGDAERASRLFAEALWLAPNSATARAGLARAKGRN
jgi:Flp pilus assembly protein TadD